MAGMGTKYLGFLLVLHTLLYFAGAHGVTDFRADDNPHKKYVEKFRGDNLTEKGALGDNSGIIDSTFGPLAAMADFINTLVGILTSPYSAINATPLPTMFKWLLQGLMGVMELGAIGSFIRGVEL